MDDPKNFVLGKFFENVPKWAKSQSDHHNISISSPDVGHHGSNLEFFFQKIFQKNFLVHLSRLVNWSLISYFGNGS